MNKLTLTVILLVTFSIGFSQNEIEELVQEGIELHDNGNFNQAIEVYKKALEINPKSSLVHYEIALSYFKNKNYDKAIDHSNIVIKIGKEHVLQSYLTKGSSLDMLGKTKKSIKLFEKGLKKFDNYYLFHYNISLNYFKLKDYKNTEKHAIEAIKENPNHSSSHLLLSYSNFNRGKKVKSFLPIHYFLMLEPDSERSKSAFITLKKILGSNVTKDKSKPKTINISLPASGLNDEFSVAEMMISFLEASKNIEKNKGKSEEELFILNTTSIFEILGESKKGENNSFYSDFYVPFFYNLAKTKHMEAYCNYISQSINNNAEVWLAENNTKLNNFIEWVSKN
jgi:tetratricopeptide (TPR) repeat protein